MMKPSFSHRICALVDTLLVEPFTYLFPGSPTIEIPCAVSIFTPNAQFEPRHLPLQRSEEQKTSGRVRISRSDAKSCLVPIETEVGVQLALIHCDAPGITVDVLDTGDAMKPGWLVVQEVTLPDNQLSEPLDWPDDPRISTHLDQFAKAYSKEVATNCADGLREMRRTLARTSHANGVLSESQLTSHAISRLEIEIGLLGDAVARPDLPIWPLLCAVERCQAAFVTLVNDLDLDFGLHWSRQPGAWPSDRDSGYFGGLRMVEGEDARRRGLLTGQMQ